MNKLLTLILLPLSLAASSFAQSPDQLTITRVLPDKLLYNTGEKVSVAVTVSNPTATEQTGEVRAKLEWEMDEGVSLGNQTVTIKPKEEKTLNFDWKSKQVLGAGAYAELVQDGKVISAAHDFFNVVDRSDSMRVSLQSAISNISPTAINRANYINHYEVVGWGGGTINGMNPQRLHPGEAGWPGNYCWVTPKNLKELCHNPDGIKILAYVISYIHQISGERISVREPDRFLFDADGTIGVMGFDLESDAIFHRMPREPGMILAGTYTVSPDWTQDRNLYFWADEMLKSAKEFGWAGVRFDGGPEFIAPESIEYYDSKGRRFTLAEKLASSKETNAKFKKYIKSKSPDFLLYYNGEPSLDKVTTAAALPELASGGSVVGSEVTRHMVTSGNPYNRWDELYERFALNVELCRKDGGYYSAIIAPPHMHMGPESTHLAYATLFATGTQPWFGMVPTPKHSDPASAYIKTGEITVPYYKTMTRYSSLFFGHGLTRVPEPEKSITVTPPGDREIWWKRNVQTRTTLGGKKLLIMSFLNKPPTETNLGTKQTLPAPIENFTVSFKPIDGKLPAKIWNIQPWPDTVTTELPIKKEGENVVVTIPRLDYASVLVGELK